MPRTTPELPPGMDPAGRVLEPKAPKADPVAGVLMGLAGLVGLLVFVRLGRPSLWIDEVLTWMDAHAQGGNYNRLGYFIVRKTVELLGGEPSEAALRLAPALAGWLAIPATAWAFLPLAGARRAALAALFVACSPWQLYWAQNARFYTFVELAGLVGVGALLRGLAVPEARRALVWLAAGLACLAAGALFQLQSLLVLAAFVVALLVVRPGRQALAAATGVGPRPGGAAAPLDAAQRARRVALVWRLGVAAAVLLAALAVPAERVFARYMLAKKGGGLGDALGALLALGNTIRPSFGAAFLVGAVYAARQRAGLFAALVPTFGAAVVVALGFLTKTTAQYAFAFLPWIALVAAWPVGPGRASGPGSPKGWGRSCAWAFLVGAPLWSASLLQVGPGYGDRPRWREAVAHIEAGLQPGDLVLSLPAPPAEFYMSRGHVARGAADADRARLRPGRLATRVGVLDSFNPSIFERPARDGRPMWIVLRTDYLLTWPPADRARLVAFLRDECRLDARFPVRVEARDLDLEVWRRD
ncbi:MAG: hypothetical protein R3F49_01165 [Planctomycetota bacterium]